MYEIKMHQVSDDFKSCWHTAMMHLETRGREVIKWLKSDLVPPFLDHISFRIGNQLFFIRLEDKDNNLDTPSNPDGLKMIADGCDGIACHMPMIRKGINWEVDASDWGLINPKTKELINPYDIVTNENIIMTDWEIQDFAVQVVRNYIKDKLGFKIFSSQGNPSVHPSLWFKGKEKDECVIVGSARFGGYIPELPTNIDDIIKTVSNVTDKVHFASVCFYHPKQKNNNDVLPLYRGHGTAIKFNGLRTLT